MSLVTYVLNIRSLADIPEDIRIAKALQYRDLHTNPPTDTLVYRAAFVFVLSLPIAYLCTAAAYAAIEVYLAHESTRYLQTFQSMLQDNIPTQVAVVEQVLSNGVPTASLGNLARCGVTLATVGFLAFLLVRPVYIRASDPYQKKYQKLARQAPQRHAQWITGGKDLSSIIASYTTEQTVSCDKIIQDLPAGAGINYDMNERARVLMQESHALREYFERRLFRRFWETAYGLCERYRQFIHDIGHLARLNTACLAVAHELSEENGVASITINTPSFDWNQAEPVNRGYNATKKLILQAESDFEFAQIALQIETKDSLLGALKNMHEEIRAGFDSMITHANQMTALIHDSIAIQQTTAAETHAVLRDIRLNMPTGLDLLAINAAADNINWSSRIRTL